MENSGAAHPRTKTLRFDPISIAALAKMAGMAALYNATLIVTNIDHMLTKAQSPQRNGIHECFHKTIYTTVEELEKDLDA